MCACVWQIIKWKEGDWLAAEWEMDVTGHTYNRQELSESSKRWTRNNVMGRVRSFILYHDILTPLNSS